MTVTTGRQERPLIVASDASIHAEGGRLLIDGLRLAMGREHVAVVGRNGVGKSTLLSVLAGVTPHERVRCRGTTHVVPQRLTRNDDDDGDDGDEGPMSPGELRRRRLTEARRSGADVLFLDEPTSDLDDAAVAWLRGWLPSYRGGVVLVSHDRRLLADMKHFFWIREAGCRYFGGTLTELDAEQAREEGASEQRYLRSMTHLAAQEERTLHLARRKARKKQYGRSRELGRATATIRLNKKRSEAQVSQGRSALVRQARLDTVRSFAKATRAALAVRLPLVLTARAKERAAEPALLLRDVSAVIDGRVLFEHVDVGADARRLAVVGPNGAGKTTLLDIVMRRRISETGVVRSDLGRIGEIAQGGANWVKEESLLDELTACTPESSPERLAEILAAHRFPLGLAERSLRSLSPGERVRAALICLFVRDPAIDLLVLDEPTFSLDQPGRAALIEALAAWPRDLLVATHDRELLEEVGFDRVLTLGAAHLEH